MWPIYAHTYKYVNLHCERLSDRPKKNTNISTHKYTCTYILTHGHIASNTKWPVEHLKCYKTSAAHSLYLSININIQYTYYTYQYLYHTLIYPKSWNLITIYYNYCICVLLETLLYFYCNKMLPIKICTKNLKKNTHTQQRYSFFLFFFMWKSYDGWWYFLDVINVFFCVCGNVETYLLKTT